MRALEAYNKQRDKKNQKELEEMGWNVLTAIQLAPA